MLKYWLTLSIGVALSAVFLSAYVGVKYFDGTVVEKPYDTAKRWGSDMQAASQSSWSLDADTVRLTQDSRVLGLALRDAQGQQLTPGRMRMQLSHQLHNRQDLEFEASLDSGQLELPGPFPEPGVWQLRVFAPWQDGEFPLSVTLYVDAPAG